MARHGASSSNHGCEALTDMMNLGARLRAARERRGMSQQAVADTLGLPRTAVTNMETGNRTVSTLELGRLSEIYGQPAAFLLGEDEPGAEDISVVLHRALPEMGQTPEVDQAVTHIIDLCREGAGLKLMLNQATEQTVPDYSARMASSGDAIRQGQQVAQEERRRMGLGNSPLGNIASMITEQGIWAAASDLPDSLSGFFVKHASIGLAILVNDRHWPVRRRFSYAHEYAHALFDRQAPVTTTRRENSSELIEKRANAFAAAFLMPAEGVVEQLAQLDKGRPSRQAQVIFDVANNASIEAEIRPRPGSQFITYQDAAALARHFGVSYEAAVWRLKSLGHIGQGETDALIGQKDVGKRYIKLLGFLDILDEGEAPQANEVELRNQLTRLALEAYRQEEISRGRLSEISRKLGIDPAEMIDLAEAACAG
ncbi:putative transcriptional regulator, XRE family [Magnetospirillum gryphiswaldense MSR-1 v2]|uniref:Transcriptional regulator, XRE family n=1 Tax=Magnetospirillum gryphiswaldense (strain DSM 6361 / JCM 21280 / NBRC 15271 / MSR-1) TaxID=431944 RepID=V6F8H6_MAGGM|nr:putative transcriptional regulator, XRE family [Magnetospirillum gryphiswaldense MSR-1 v2]